MDDSSEIFSTPKLLLNGEGDGIKNITVRRRVPVSSSRKFNPYVPPDEEMRIRIGKALSELQGRPRARMCLKKAQTVAEITPTKSKATKKRPPTKTTDDRAATATLHATPRPVDEETPPASSSGRCPRERAVCAVYQRLLLCAWRRSRERLATLSESCGRQQEQINQLELQVEVLKNLRYSESQKRNEALTENQQLKKKLEILDEENSKLNQKLRNSQEELDDAEEKLSLRNVDLKKCSEQIVKMQEMLKRRKEERLELLAKISTQEFELLRQNSVVTQLEDQLKIAENNLQNIESNYRVKQDECNELFERFQTEASMNSSLNEQVKTLHEIKEELEVKSRDLENQLEDYSLTCEELIDENISMRCNLHEVSMELSEAKRKRWLRSAKEIASMSLFALQKIAYIMLPAYLDSPIK